MTPLKPLENRRVRGVASTRYPLNTICAHPECTEPAVDPHHTFPRSQIVGDSWFVEIETGSEHPEFVVGQEQILPHVTGLCRAHHEGVEEHRAWIKLEGGEFRWYDRFEPEDIFHVPPEDVKNKIIWKLLGNLNPQPGSREGKPKRKKFKGEKKRTRTTWSIRVPKDAAEDGVEILKLLVEQAAEKLGDEGVPPYYVLVKVLHEFIVTPPQGDPA